MYTVIIDKEKLIFDDFKNAYEYAIDKIKMYLLNSKENVFGFDLSPITTYGFFAYLYQKNRININDTKAIKTVENYLKSIIDNEKTVLENIHYKNYNADFNETVYINYDGNEFSCIYKGIVRNYIYTNILSNNENDKVLYFYSKQTINIVNKDNSNLLGTNYELNITIIKESVNYGSNRT